MALELKQSLKLTQKLVMTPQLKQAIRLLQLGRLELSDTLRNELAQNPMLEEIEPEAPDRNAGEGEESLSAVEEAGPAEEPAVTAPLARDGEAAAGLAEINWDDYANSFDADLSFGREAPPADAPSRLDFVSAQPGLEEQLGRQLMSLNLDETDRRLTAFIIGNLNRHGYLDIDIPDIARACGCAEEEAEGALRLVQSLEPAGIGARNLAECLTLQLEREPEEDAVALRIVAECLHLLEKRDYARIARELGVTQVLVSAAVGHIRNLDPYPGNEYDNGQTHYNTPDVYVFKVDDDFVIRLNDEDLPQLRLSPEYLAMLKEDGRNGRGINARGRAFLLENKRNAEWIIRSVEQRQRTIYRVVESLLKFQREFFEKGPLHMKPLVLRDVAEDIGMHESTISRVTANKYVQTPEGLFELKYFFTSAVTNANGSTVGAEAIKTRIRQLVHAEDPTHPLSDNRIAEILAAEDIEVARRTVAKYREQMKILPVKHRRHAARGPGPA